MVFDGFGDAGKGALRLFAAVGLVGGVTWWISRPTLAAAEKLEEEFKKLAPVLEHLLRALFFECTEVSYTTKLVHSKIDATNPGMADKLKDMWRTQVFERLKRVQMETVQHFGFSLEELQEMQTRHDSKEEVIQFIEGGNEMLKDALEGSLPVLTLVQIPGALTHEKILAVLGESYKLEEKKVKKAMHRARGKRQQVTLKDFDSMCSLARKDALDQAISLKLPEIGSQKEVYMSALASYSRDPAFVEKRLKVDKTLRPNWESLLTPANLKAVPMPSVAGTTVPEVPFVAAHDSS